MLPEFEIVNEPEEDEDEGVLLKIYKGDKKGAGSLKQAGGGGGMKARG